MKYAIVIPDGCADEPQAALGGKTPLQAAHLPNMDRIARTGVVGRSNNVPQPLTPASDVATLSLFGYDPLVVYTGRAPLETAAGVASVALSTANAGQFDATAAAAAMSKAERRRIIVMAIPLSTLISLARHSASARGAG